MESSVLEKQAEELAVREVLSPSLDLTRQLLASHSLIRRDGNPLVTRVAATYEPGAFHVFFSIQEAEYSFVVAVRPDSSGHLAASWTYLQPAIDMRLGVFSENLSAQDLAVKIALKPSASWSRGEIVPPRRVPTRYSGWVLSAEPAGPGSFEEKFAALEKIVTPFAHQFRDLSSSCDVELGVGYTGWGGDPQFGGVALSANDIAFLNKIGASLDLDLYASGPNSWLE